MIVGLQRYSAQLFLIFLISNMVLIPSVMTNTIIQINIKKKRALLNDHKGCSDIFLLTTHNQVFGIFPLLILLIANDIDNKESL